MTLQELARVLRGEVRGHQVLAPGPGHSPKDRSLAVTPSSTAPDGFVVYSHAGDDPIVCKDYVRERSSDLHRSRRPASAAAALPLITVRSHPPEDDARPEGPHSIGASALAAVASARKTRSAGGTSRNVADCTLGFLMTCPTHFGGTRVSAPSLR